MSFKHFGRQQGLSNRSVNCIEEDSLGVIWVGTRQGLNRLQGQIFRNYYATPDGLTGNIINALQADRGGTSLSPADYIRLFRLKRGAELLSERRYRVKEVADRIGFSSTSYFTTSFMRQFGMTPTDFLKAQGQQVKDI